MHSLTSSRPGSRECAITFSLLPLHSSKKISHTLILFSSVLENLHASYITMAEFSQEWKIDPV